MKHFIAVILFFCLTVLLSCKTKVIVQPDNPKVSFETLKDSVQPIVKLFDSIENYHAARTRENDLVHTKLDVKFNWQKKQLMGQATITLTPHFYPVNKLELDAKGFDIAKVELLTNAGNKPLKYSYDSLMLKIALDKTYEQNEKYTIYIKYTAKPDDLPHGTGKAITDTKGLYFIIPESTDFDKPYEIWTQGETEFSSCWFPTIDAPNQRCTQEMLITVDKKYKTLSNGLLVTSLLNQDSTRTDYWKMDKPHAPYLFMMAIGDYAVINDHWKNIPLTYWVEPKYEKIAKNIFGKTPQMMTLYSKLFGVDYPWDKYAQVVVRDYVSGAMENTTATVFGEFLYQDPHDMVDDNYEIVIAHELSHHWFGDYVTCKSWANITLNEGFATYAEYLWTENSKSVEDADYGLMLDRKAYLLEYFIKKENLIRYFYDKPDDLFDSHSYKKGGCVLHMLRKYVGDKAFFAALKLYLTEHQFSAVEINDLRLAFEKVTGEDLNWFFDQWFFRNNYPVLNIAYKFNETTNASTVTIEQTQKTGTAYKLPLKVDVYVDNDIQHKQITMTRRKQDFVFFTSKRPQLINVDADKALLCEKTDNKTKSEYLTQFYRAPTFLDKLEALNGLANDSDVLRKVYDDGLDDKNWYIRALIISRYDFPNTINDTTFVDKLKRLALFDPSPKVRYGALFKLSEIHAPNLKNICKDRLQKDSSNMVVNVAFEAMRTVDSAECFRLANEYIEIPFLKNKVLEIYAKFGGIDKNIIFKTQFQKSDAHERWNILNYYSNFITRFNDDSVESGLKFLEKISRTDKTWWVRGASTQCMNSIAYFYGSKSQKIEDKLVNLIPNSEPYKNLSIIELKYKNKETEIRQRVKNIIDSETNKQLKDWYKNMD